MRNFANLIKHEAFTFINLKNKKKMSISWSVVASVLIALVIFKAVDKMFLDSAFDKAFNNFEEE